MTSYYRQAKENERPASREFAEISASIILPEKERTSRNIHKIFQWMEMHADSEGNFQERSLFTYGRCYGTSTRHIESKTQRKKR